MDALYGSAETYAQILRNCSLPQVADWDIEDVERAHEWAKYFYKVHGRIADKPSAVRKLDTKLRDFGYQLGIRFGEEELSYDFLPHTSDYFTKCLLDNPVLPKELYDKECSTSPNVTQQHITEKGDAKVLLSTLTSINERLVACCGEGDLLKDLKSVDAMYLRKDLLWLLERQRSNQHQTDRGTSVQQRLSSLAVVEGGMAVILTALLQDSEDCSSVPTHPDSLDTARRAILDWLMMIAVQGDKKETHDIVTANEQSDTRKKDLGNISDILWQKDHCKLLAQVSVRYFDFFKAHFQFLVKKTKLIEKMRLESYSEEETSGRDKISLDEQMAWATSHWVELVLVGEQLRDVCMSFLSKEPLSNKESTHAAVTMRVPNRESIWCELLAAIHKAKY